MKIKAKITKEFEVVAIRIHAKVRYWEDGTVNGVEDAGGSLIPFRSGDLWEPIIDLDTGRVHCWPEGMTARVCYKVCDEGQYELIDGDGIAVARKDGYVPDLLDMVGDSFGDYIQMTIGPDGLIKEWRPSIDLNDWEWESA